jgi:predicted RNA polymerase sigma factor
MLARVVDQQSRKYFAGESGRVLPKLIRLLGDFIWPKQARQEAFIAAIEQWAATEYPRIPAHG